MPTKRLERLMFVQGGNCFFCKSPVAKADASIEHLFASANGGGNNDENCVACCKALNAVLGSLSLKEKFQVVLNQKGNFKCPGRMGAVGSAADIAIVKAKLPSQKTPKVPAASVPIPDNVTLAVANLKQRGSSRPRTLKTLTSTVASILPKATTEAVVANVIQELQASGTVTIDEGKVSYSF